MKAGRASRTAEYVCIGRAVAHGAPWAGRFSDPTALTLLPDDARELVARMRANGFTKTSARERFRFEGYRHRAYAMVARTIAIDDAVAAAGAPQVVILGAGLDGRAWRMAALHDAIVFEVDHPDSQREKRARVDKLARVAREARFVAVDFTRDSLEAALAGAGHDPTLPTTWIWEGVVMYLAPTDIEATLSVVARRSAPGSYVIVAYFVHALLLAVLRPLLRLVGEPVRSVHTVAAMRALLARHGFDVVRDDALSELGAGVSAQVAKGTRRMKHLRVATARRGAAATR